ncbi:MAG: hypothetical protein WBD07_03235 [Vicinamibacterales bacterium]
MAALELAFAKKSLRALCESEAMAAKALGVRVAARLRHRLADARAAACVSDLVAGSPRATDSGPGQHIALDLCDGYRIVFRANHVITPKRESGEVDWSLVRRVKVMAIENAHGQA